MRRSRFRNPLPGLLHLERGAIYLWIRPILVRELGLRSEPVEQAARALPGRRPGAAFPEAAGDQVAALDRARERDIDQANALGRQFFLASPFDRLFIRSLGAKVDHGPPRTAGGPDRGRLVAHLQEAVPRERTEHDRIFEPLRL